MNETIICKSCKYPFCSNCNIYKLYVLYRDGKLEWMFENYSKSTGNDIPLFPKENPVISKESILIGLHK